MISETVFCDCEVDKRSLSLNFRRVVRVRQLRMHEESEVFVQDEILSTELQNSVLTSLEGVSSNNWVKGSIDLLVEVFKQYGVTVLSE